MFFQKLSNSCRIIYLYIKYQLVTKLLLTALIFPIYSFVLRFLIKSTGRVNISSGDFLPFLFSFQGLGMLIATLVLISFLIATDINVFIILSSLIHENKVVFKIKDTIKIAIKSLKSFFSISGLLMMFYVTLIIPILGVGVTISPMKNFQIPNFITSVIYSNPFYFSIYVFILLIFGILGTVFAFSFHYIIISKCNGKDAFKNSFLLIKKYFKNFLKDFLLWIIIRILLFFVIFGVIVIVILIPVYLNRIDVFLKRSISFFIFITCFEIFELVAFLSVPVLIHRLTELFYLYNEKEGINVSVGYSTFLENINERKKIRLRKAVFTSIVFVCILSCNIIISVIMTYSFDYIFDENNTIALVAHRGGGDLGAENTIEGLKNAIKENAKYSEIDVQRTKDGKYIINHDKTFKRLCGVSKASTDMDLEEIKNLKVENEFDDEKESQPVATLEEMLETAKGKIGLFIELKGTTADNKMVDDVVKMVKERKMEKEVVLISLDYSLIKYIEEKYHEMDSGFLYFFSIGQTDEMVGDYLIMEELEATENNIELIKEKGKKAIVWTVNTDTSIQRFINSDVDGIITDHIKAVKKALNEKEKRSDLEIIFQRVFN